MAVKKSISIFLFLSFFCVFIKPEDSLVKWKFKTGGIIYSSPLIINNTVYIGSQDSNFYAISLDNGEEIWHFKAGNRILSTAAISDTVICFESGNELYGLNLSGTKLWKVTIAEGTVTNQYDEWDCIHSSPVIADSIAYCGSERGQLIGVNIYTGREVYRIDTGDRGVGIRTKPAIYDGKIYFGECSGIFYCYDLSTKSEIWTYDTNPEKLWHDPNIETDVVIKENIVYFGGRNCHLYALDVATGEKKWMYSDPNNMWILGGPEISDSLIYMGSSNQKIIHSFSTQTHKLRWKRSVDGRIFGSPNADSNYVFFGTGMEVNDALGSLYAIDKITGEIKSRLSINSQVHSSVKIEGNTICFGSRDGNIYAVDKRAFLNMKYSDTKFKTQGSLNLGTITSDTTITLTILNEGAGDDSVSLKITGISAPSGSVELEYPTGLMLPAHDSINISLKISTALLSESGYFLMLELASKNNMISQKFSRMVMFTFSLINSVDNTNVSFSYSLEQNYPNPFNPETKIRYSIASADNVNITVFDSIGKKIKELVNEYKPAGNYSLVFRGSDLSSGIYFYKLSSGPFEKVRKLVLLR